MIDTLLRRATDERGVTLPELLVAMALAAIVTSGLVAAVASVYRGRNYTAQDSESLAALRTAIDRFEKEVRQARRMYSDSGAKRAHMWVDYDRDNQQDLSERIAWEITDVGGNRAELTRTTGDPSATPVTVARNLVFNAAASEFTYNAADPIDASVIGITFVARGQGSLAGARTVRTEVRLRNADF
jgi:prepilin-type N-terminal cleavage/methylation domain-containing protein